MKKTYKNPTLLVVNIQPAHLMQQASVPMEGKDATGPGMTRRGRFSGWEEDDDFEE